MTRNLFSEWLGTFFLVAVVIGSGIMAERLAGGNDAIAFLGNTIATGAILVVIIFIFGPLSGAHFNPAVTLAFAIRRDIDKKQLFIMCLFKYSVVLPVQSLRILCSNYICFKRLKIFVAECLSGWLNLLPHSVRLSLFLVASKRNSKLSLMQWVNS